MKLQIKKIPMKITVLRTSPRIVRNNSKMSTLDMLIIVEADVSELKNSILKARQLMRSGNIIRFLRIRMAVGL